MIRNDNLISTIKKTALLIDSEEDLKTVISQMKTVAEDWKKDWPGPSSDVFAAIGMITCVFCEKEGRKV